LPAQPGPAETPVVLPSPPGTTTTPPTPAAPEHKTLQIRSTPEGARIWINGVEQSQTTPATIDLSPDTPAFVTVRVSRGGYQAIEREVEVVTGAAVFELQGVRSSHRAIRRRRHR
jgi:hypothetical protein